MPTNLPPDYFEIEKRFRLAETTEEKIELLEEMYSVVPKHKGTDHLRADLRRKLAKLKEETQIHKGGGKHDSVYSIPKAGAGQVVVIGPAGVGKSSLVAALTGSEALHIAASQPTFEPAPGMLLYNAVQIQLVDTPPFNREFVEPRLKDLIRRADMILLVVDLEEDPIQQLKETIILLEEARIISRHLQDRYPPNPLLHFLPLVVLVNKCDDDRAEELYKIFCELLDEKWPCIPISALNGRNLGRVRQEIFDQLEIIRVYTKTPGKDADLTHPFVLKKGSTVEDLAGRIHKDFLEKMKFARAWGKTVYDGQLVHRDYLLQDGDVVEIHI